jgi:hypothetical protein
MVVKRESLILAIGIKCYVILFHITYTELNYGMYADSDSPRLPALLGHSSTHECRDSLNFQMSYLQFRLSH